MISMELIRPEGREGCAEEAEDGTDDVFAGLDGEAAAGFAASHAPAGFHAHEDGAENFRFHEDGVVAAHFPRVREVDQFDSQAFEFGIAFVVADAFGFAGEFAGDAEERGNVVLAPFGPKPFALASVVLAAERRRVSCINAKKIFQTRSAAPATGDLILTRIRF